MCSATEQERLRHILLRGVQAKKTSITTPCNKGKTLIFTVRVDMFLAGCLGGHKIFLIDNVRNLRDQGTEELLSVVLSRELD